MSRLREKLGLHIQHLKIKYWNSYTFPIATEYEIYRVMIFLQKSRQCAIPEMELTISHFCRHWMVLYGLESCPILYKAIKMKRKHRVSWEVTRRSWELIWMQDGGVEKTTREEGIFPKKMTKHFINWMNFMSENIFSALRKKIFNFII